MKKISKLVVIALAVTLLVGGFTACSKKSDSNSTGTLNEGKIIFGTNPEFPPFEYVTTNGVIGEYDGIDMAIANEIAKDSGLTPEVANLEFDSLLIALDKGQVDCVIAGMTVTEERKQSVDFTDSYYVATQVMIVPEDSAIAKAEDMKDKKIVCVQGYTGQTCLDELAKDGGYKYEAFKKGTEAVMEVANGKADAFVIDSATAEKYIKDTKGLKIVKDEKAFESEEYAIAVKKGNSELLKILNDGITKLKESGKISEWAKTYSEAQ